MESCLNPGTSGNREPEGKTRSIVWCGGDYQDRMQKKKRKKERGEEKIEMGNLLRRVTKKKRGKERGCSSLVTESGAGGRGETEKTGGGNYHWQSRRIIAGGESEDRRKGNWELGENAGGGSHEVNREYTCARS